MGLAWSYDLETLRGVEATPLVKDGVLYATSAWSIVYAFDAKTGKAAVEYDPKVPKDHAKYVCCDVVNRGVALYKGRVYVGTLDGRLIALDAKTGVSVWDVQTTPKDGSYAITAAPRIAKGRVLIGNAGAEYPVRGYVSAYDAETGNLVWRTYTVPGDPSKPFESDAMKRAAATWSGEWWKAGGGGTVWESMVYDPELDLVYFGTGNASPWYDQLRGKGDNLYVASIVAVRADNGEQVWALPDDAGRQLGLRRDAADDAGHAHHRRRSAPRGDAGEQERLLLRNRPGKRKTHFGEALCPGQLGHRHRSERATH